VLRGTVPKVVAAPRGTNWPAVKHGVFAFTALELHCLWTAAMGVARMVRFLHVVAAKPKPGGSVDNAEGEAGVIEKCPGHFPATDGLVQKAVAGFER